MRCRKNGKRAGNKRRESMINIGIDHGNGNIKTEHVLFTCGLSAQQEKISEFFAADWLCYNGTYYALTSDRLPHKTDKTTDGDYQIFTLFAIAKELRARAESEDRAFSGFAGKEVVLSVGLPPADFERLKVPFKKYLMDLSRNGVNYRYNDKPMSFYIRDVYVYPQDFAACVIYKPELIKEYSTVHCVDIGDGTVDIIDFVDGRPDKSTIDSYEMGISQMRDKMKESIRRKFGKAVRDKMIDDVLQGKKVICQDEVKAEITHTAAEWSQMVIGKLLTKVGDFSTAPTIFCGGGSITLKPYICQSGVFAYTDFIEDIHANAVGYQTITASIQK
jgi:plasmid segregation protein ParM